MQNAPDCIIINDNSENFNCNTEEYKNQLPLGYAKRNLNGAKADTDIIKDNAENFNCNTEEYINDKSSLSTNVLRSVKNLNEDTNSINENAENFNSNTENTKIVLGLPNTKTVS